MKDIIKKILISVIILEIIIIIISAIIIVNSKHFKAEENTKNISENITNEEIQETVGNSIEEEQTMDKNTIKEDNSLQQKEDVQNIKNSENPSKYNPENVQQKNYNKDNSETIKEQKEISPKKETKSNSQSQVQVQNNSNKEPSKTKETEDENIPKTNTVTYKYNANITNKMISIIKSNESDYMKEYGYTVVVDESIISLTNQFTYSDQRVKDKLKYKFGEIRVYARDYYINDTYVWTECYLI